MQGNEYRDCVAGYLARQLDQEGIDVKTEITLGRSILGKMRRVDVMLTSAGGALAIETKHQDTPGTAEEKVFYALADLAAMPVPGVLVYGGGGWSDGARHYLDAHPAAVYYPSDNWAMRSGPATREIDTMIATRFKLWRFLCPPELF